jgi:hypothetical protein
MAQLATKIDRQLSSSMLASDMARCTVPMVSPSRMMSAGPARLTRCGSSAARMMASSLTPCDRGALRPAPVMSACACTRTIGAHAAHQ